ncbi:MAG: hypothetical protein LBN05_07670 [Oscillospiraceae bacterium]|jgi:penicillin-binding protein 2|nr:hypothetical protein [Oscillospiraceae bacterium]
MNEKQLLLRRVAAFTAVILCFVGFLSAMGYWQVVGGTGGVVDKSELTPIPAARGEIVDTNGVPLIVNRQSNNLVFKAGLFPASTDKAARNKLLYSLIHLLESRKIEWLDKLPLVFDAKGKIQFKEDSDTDIAWLKSREMLYVNDYATAGDCFNALIERFDLAGYKPADQRKLASVQSELWHQGFRVAAPYTFALDVPADLVAQIKEQSAAYPGVDTEIVPVREYAVPGDVMPQILGRVAALDPVEYARLKSKGYRMNDVIGKSGLEKELEDTLRGTEGKKRITLGRDGTLTETIVQPSVQGNTVVLNIDYGLQKWLLEAFADYTENTIKDKRLSYASGAAIILNPNNGAVLACVSYPTYDISKYAEIMGDLAKRKDSPEWDRALMSAFPPGSTIKPSVAVTALENHVITSKTTFYCRGTYTLGGTVFHCPQAGLHAANVDLLHSITASCNTFYYNCAVNLGIDKLNEYRTFFGFGQKTGIELQEIAGVLDSPEYRESLGQEWMSGLTVQAGIAQGGNAFTPLQVANYAATLANGGTRYVPRVVKSIKSYNLTETVEEKAPEVAAKVPVSAENLKLVTDAMRTFAKGNASLRSDKVDMAAKTGTNQRAVPGQKGLVSDGWLISFAPYDKPEIAVCTFMELASGSSVTAAFTRKVHEYYFSRSTSFAKPQAENTLLG